MAGISDTQIREKIPKLLEGIDLGSTSIGKLRASLEQALGLQAGALDARKDQVNVILREELVKKVKAGAGGAPAEKRPAEGKPDKEPVIKKEKREKKEGKDKKEKKDRKKDAEKKEIKEEVKDDASEEALEAEDLPAAAPPEAEKPQEPEPEAKAPEATMGMSAFEEFDAKEAVPQKKASRLQTWAVSGAEDGHLRLWDLESYTCTRVLEGHEGVVRALAVDWEEMQALSGADDNVRLWSLKRGGCQRTFSDIEEGCHAVAADWKGNRALTGCGDGQLKLWSMTSGECISSVAAHPGGVWTLEVRWQAKRVASGGDEHLKVWDLSDWSCLHKIEGHPGGIMCLTVDWEDLRVLVGVSAAERSLCLWDTETRKARSMLGHRDAVAHVFADWDTEVALSGGWDAQLRLWGIAKGSCTQVHECKFGRVRSMAVDFTQMQAICGSSAGTLHFVDLHSGADLRKLEGHVGGVTALQAKF